METAIRPVTRDELRETVEIYLECLRADLGYQPQAYLDSRDVEAELAECEAWLYAPGQPNQIFAAFAGARMAGYIAVGPNVGKPPGYEGEVTGFFIRRAFRSLGIGLRLLKTGVEYLHRLGYRNLIIYNHHLAPSNGYYLRLGGQVVDRVVRSPGGMDLETDVFGWEMERLLEILEERLHKYK